MGSREVGAGEIGSVETSSSGAMPTGSARRRKAWEKSRKSRHAVLEDGAGTRGPIDLGLDEDGARKIGRRQVGALELRPGKVGALQVFSREILAREGGLRQVRRDVDVAGTPGVPFVGQKQRHMLGIGHRE
jgi:hypothetical protein